jgi:hypothetical protein
VYVEAKRDYVFIDAMRQKYWKLKPIKAGLS